MTLRLRAASMLGAAIAAAVALSPGVAGDRVVVAPAARVTAPPQGRSEVALLGGGCFWGVEGVYRHVRGVTSVTSGYAGGTAADAHYDIVSEGGTGHAESVRIVFDPTKVSYADLLRIYFSVVTDPTQVDRQGPDTGSQYRSVLFPQTPAQERVARAYLAQLSAAHLYDRPIATRIERDRGFFPAEAHHQDFMARNLDYPYIVINDAPKVAALKRVFPQSWRA